MPATAKQLSQSALTATTTTTLYTVPASTRTTVKEILLCNTDSSARTVTMFMGSASGVANTILSAISVAAGETKFISLSTTLETGQTIKGGASVTSVVSATITGIEVS